MADENRKAEIVVGLRADGVQETVSAFKTGMSDISGSAATESAKANKSLASLGIPPAAIADIERFKSAFGDIGRVTAKELGESARATNAFVQSIKRAATDTSALTQDSVTSFVKKQSSDLRLQNEVVDKAIAAAQKLASENALVAASVKEQAKVQAENTRQINASTAAFENFSRSANTAIVSAATAGKTISESLQFKATRAGLGGNAAAQQLIAEAKAIDDAIAASALSAQKKVTPVMSELVKGTKAYNAALRSVPAQFTDIIVSLQGGQAPLTVLLQQGGQLKDMFGGVGAAARAAAGYVKGLINPYTLAAAAVGTLGFAYYKGSQETDAFRKALVTTGNQAGVTTGALADMAKNISAVSGTTGAAAAALAQFAASGAVGAAGLQKFTAAALDFEKFTGTAVAETVKRFESLGKAPLEASIKLNESTNFLTTSLYEQIKALTEQGRTIEAANLAQNAFADTLSGRASEVKANLGYIERGWLAIKSAVLGVGDALLDVGRKETIGAQIAAKQALISQYQKNGYDTTKEQAELDALNRRALREQDIATSKAQQKLETENLVAANKILDSFASKQVKMEKEILASRTALVRAGIDNKIVEETIGKIREKYKEKASKPAGISEAAREVEKGLRVYNDLIAKSTDLNADFEEKWNGLSAAYRGRKIDLDQLTAAQKELLSEQRFSKEADKAWADQSAASAKAVADLSKDYDAYVKTLDSAANAAVKQVQALEGEEKALVIAAEQNISLAQAIEQVTIARLKKAQTEAYAKGDQEAGDAIKREIEARKKLATLIGGKEVRDANKKAADDAAKEWQKTADKINDSITDALMRGFESGKGFAENLRDSVVNMFKTMVLRPVVQATVNGGLQALGIPGVGGSSGGAGGLLNAASNVNTLYGAATQYFTGASAGATAASLASANAVGLAGGDALGALIAGNGGWAGVSVAAEAGAAAGAASGAAAASTAAGTAAAGTGAAGALAAIPGWGWALGGALLLAGMMGGDNGPKLASTGDAIRRYDKGGALTENASNGAWFFTNTQDANKLLDGLESRYQKAAKALGIGTVATQFDYGSNNRGNFALAGAAGNSRANTGEIAYSAEAMQVAASRAVFAALQGSELPKYLSGLLDSVGDINALSQAQIDDVLNTAQAFKGLHDVMVQMPFEALHDLSYNAAKGLVEFSGGLDKLTQNLGTYYDNFYSAEEKKAQTLANITKTLTDAGALTKTTRTAIAGEFDVRVGAQGDTSLEQRYATSIENIDMPKTREEFRALVESMRDLGGEAPQKAYAALLSVSGAFASVTPAANDATAALEKDLAARASWQQKLDLLTGAKTEQDAQLANDLAGVTDLATISLIKQVNAQQNLKTALESASESMKTLKENAEALQKSQLGWTDKYSPPDIKTLADRLATAIGGSGISDGKTGAQLAGMTSQQLKDYAATLSQVTVQTTKETGRIEADVLRAAITNAIAGAYNADTVGGDKAIADGKIANFFDDGIANALEALGISFQDAANMAGDAALALQGSFATASSDWEKKGIATVTEKATDWVTDGLGHLTDIVTTGTTAVSPFAGFEGDIDALIAAITAAETATPSGAADTSAAASITNALADASDSLAVTLARLKDGDTAANAAQKALDTKGYTALQIAQYDANKSMEKEIATLTERKTLQDQLNALTDTAAQALARQRDALDESNRALFDNIQIETKRKAVGEERKSLQEQYDQLTMTSTQLLEKQRNALDESNRALFDSIQIETKRKAVTEQAGSFADRLAIATGTSTALEISRKNELATALDASNRATLLAIYAAEDLKTANEAAAASATALAQTNKGWQDQLDVLLGKQTDRSIALRDATDESTRALMRQVYAQQDLKTAVDTSVTNSDNALSGIQKALDAQMQASTKARDAVKGVFDLLKAEIDNLYGQVASTVSMAAIEGQAYIDTALALFKAGGTVPDQDKLGKAIAAVQGGFGNEATQFEADRNRLLLAGKLGQLQDLAGPQLTTAEQQLATTNSAYETAKAQLDTLRGIDTRVLSVAEAVEAFQVAFTGEQTARQKLLASSAQQATAIGGRSQGDADSDPGNIAAAKNWAARRIDNLVASAAGGGNLDVPRIASEIAALQQYIVSGTTQNLPSFAVGTDYVPHDMIAQIHKGEQIVPAAFNPARYQNSNNDALVAEIKALREEVKTMRENNDAGLQAVASNTMQTAKIQKRWDGDGIPAERTTT